ncbi:hypothetical protein FEP99_06792 [Burkholderia pseudomultivorans]|nr:hypothetical protein [Burkholderia pseudomultivorans]
MLPNVPLWDAAARAGSAAANRAGAFSTTAGAAGGATSSDAISIVPARSRPSPM